MAPRLPADLLGRSAQESSRLLALSYLDEIGRAEQRLANPLDDEALHDFRVGLRRLRSGLRAYRTALAGSVSKKMRRRLRNITLATNAGRDTEVQLVWLRDQAQLLGPGEVEGLAWLIGLLEGRKYEALDRVTVNAGRRFLKLAAKLGPRLMTFQVELRKERHSGPTSFAGVTAGLIRRGATDLGQTLAGVRNGEDSSEAHAARISAKRLRYLLEPVARRVPRVRAVVRRIKELQDTLGDMHDMQVLSEVMTGAMRPPGAEPGIRILQAAARDRAETAFAAFEAHWSDGREIAFLSRVEEIADSLAAMESGVRVGLPRGGTSDAPAPLVRSVAGASSTPSLSLSSTPPASRRRPQPRLR